MFVDIMYDEIGIGRIEVMLPLYDSISCRVVSHFNVGDLIVIEWKKRLTFPPPWYYSSNKMPASKKVTSILWILGKEYLARENYSRKNPYYKSGNQYIETWAYRYQQMTNDLFPLTNFPCKKGVVVQEELLKDLGNSQSHLHELVRESGVIDWYVKTKNKEIK